MKLKKLIIHNIASIEDATIDFAGRQLADQDLFLICGPTGSGKSTILDAICLALFNTTPRIENSSSDAIDELADDKKKVKDVLHIVRKNTAEAFVTLTFEGVENEECKATWLVKRKVSGHGEKDKKLYEKESLEEKLKRDVVAEWTLEDGNGTTYTKKTDVKNQIAEIIRMNFDQFCKTTMLAQGDFTKFLSSPSDKKAEILEKLVGTQRYGEVGNEINLTTREKLQKVELLKRELNNIQFFNEEDIERRNKRIAEIDGELGGLNKQREAVESKNRWIIDSLKTINEMSEANENLKTAESAMDADEVKADSALVDLWQNTEELRNNLKALEENKTQEATKKQEKCNLETEYVKAMAGLNALTEKTAKLKREIADLDDAIGKQAKFEPMFNNAAVICQAHEDVVANQKYVEVNKPKLSVFDEAIKELQKQCESHKKDQEDAKKLISEAEAQQEKLQQKLNDLGADGLTEELNRLNAHILLVNSAKSNSSIWSEAKDEAAKKNETLIIAEENHKKLEKTAAQALADLKIAEEKCSKSKALYEKMKASIEDHAKVLRAELNVGDTCPVCGKLIDEALADEKFENILKPLKEAFKNDEDAYTAMNRKNEQAKAELKADAQNVNNKKQDVENADRKLKNSHEKLEKECKALNIECNDEVDKRLEELIREDDSAKVALEKRQSEVSEVNKQKNEIAKNIANLRSGKLDVASAAITDVTKKMADKDAEKQELVGRLKVAEETIINKKQEIDSAVNGDWSPSNNDDYFKELKEAAEGYDKAKAAVDNKRNELAHCDRDHNLIEQCKDDILQKFSDWSKHDDARQQAMPNLTTLWTGLQSKAVAIATAIESIQQEQRRAEESIAKFFNDHAEVDREAVDKAISNYNAADIKAKQERLGKLKEALISAKAKVEAAEKKQKELPANPLDEGETTDTLKEQLTTINSEVQLRSEEKGRIGKELEDDEKNRKTMGKKRLELEKEQAEYAEWNTLDKYLGSTNGKNFKNVAQSFILGDLLNKANAYLENISGRYTLSCNPGSLTIMMCDSYQGGVSRPTNTLSGGESFIISLALALGLSSMQTTGFEVDTLFIDEGFGTLSPEFLDPVIGTLKRLYELYGRRVGIISHVETLKSRIPVTIEVSREGKSSSKIEIVRN